MGKTRPQIDSIRLLLLEFEGLSRNGQVTAPVIEDYSGRIRKAVRPPVLTRRSVAALLSVSLSTLDCWIKRDGLPVRYRYGPHSKSRPMPYFNEEEVLEWQYRHQALLGN